MIRLRAVGECVIEVGDERVGPDAELAFALLLVLVLSRGRPLGRRQLVDLLWPATSEARARHNLRQTLYKLRQLGVPAATESNHVRLAAAAVAPDVLLDGEVEGPPPAELLRPDLPFGEFLAGYAPAFSAPFAAWVDEQRGVMHARLRRAVLALLADERRRGSWGAVETLARKCLQLDPLNEEATLALAEATALTGSKHAALAILDGYLRELGGTGSDIRLPATLLRRRIADHLHPSRPLAIADSVFVGREESMAFLNDQLRRATRDGGRSVLVWGGAGLGKSRLLDEFGRMATLGGTRVVRVGCQARDTERPLALFVDAVPLLLALPGALGCAPESMEHLRRLTAHDPTDAQPTAPTREAELLFGSLRRAILDLVDAVASEAPLVLCVEDVHWLDAQSWRVLRELIGWLGERPILVALSARLPHPTPTPPASPVPELVVHRLPALDQGAASTLFDAVTEGAPPPATFRSWCLQVAEGNPLFLRAAGTHWIETRELSAPPSLEALVEERVRRLEPGPLRVLQGCAVLGSASHVDRLLRVLGLDQAPLVERVAELESHGLLTTAQSAVLCRHSLIEQAALGTLSPGARLVLHRCAATALEAEVRSGDSVALLWACVQQWHAAGEGARGLSLARASIAHMLAVGLPHVAAETAEELVTRCETSEDRLAVLGDLITALRLSGKWERLLQVIPEHEELRRTLSPLADRHSEKELVLIEAAAFTGADLPSLIARAESCLTDLNSTVGHRVDAAAAAIVPAYNMYDAEAVERIYASARPLLRHATVERRTALRIEAIYHTVFGDVREAIAATEERIDLERSVGDPARLSQALRTATLPYRVAGLREAAFASATEAFEIAVAHQLASNAARSADALMALNFMLGDRVNASLWFDRLRYWTARTDESIVSVYVQSSHVRLCLLHGRVDEVMRMLEDGLHDEFHASRNAHRQIEVQSVVLYALAQTDRHADIVALLPEFSQLYHAGRRFPGQDFPTAALVAALRTIGDLAAAEAILAEYISTYRREKLPLAPELAQLLRA